MSATIFNGTAMAAEWQAALAQAINQLSRRPTISSIFFAEDAGSVLYTRLKKQAALKSNINFTEHAFQISDHSLTRALEKLSELAQDPAITGIIIQKPTQVIWQQHYRGAESFDRWWQQLVEALPITKDIDGLAPATLASIKQGSWQILPATVKAVLIALEAALSATSLTTPPPPRRLPDKTVAIIGCSDIIGLPLADVLHHHSASVTLICDNVQASHTQNADIVISATGTPNIITGDMIKEGAVVLDVGAPKADVDFASVSSKASFITPVPGGIGPLTVVSLLENTLQIAQQEKMNATSVH